MCGFYKSTKIQISRERNIFFEEKKFINYTPRPTLLKKIVFLEEVNYNLIQDVAWGECVMQKVPPTNFSPNLCRRRN